MGSHYCVCIRTRRVHFLWIIHGSPVEGRLNWDVVLLSRVLGGSRALGRKFFVVPNTHKMIFHRIWIITTNSKCIIFLNNYSSIYKYRYVKDRVGYKCHVLFLYIYTWGKLLDKMNNIYQNIRYICQERGPCTDLCIWAERLFQQYSVHIFATIKTAL